MTAACQYMDKNNFLMDVEKWQVMYINIQGNRSYGAHNIIDKILEWETKIQGPRFA